MKIDKVIDGLLKRKCALGRNGLLRGYVHTIKRYLIALPQGECQ